MPEPLVPLPPSAVEALTGSSLDQTAAVVGQHLLGDQLESEIIAEVLRDGLGFPIPLVRLEEGLYVLELFHGPTAAFKDVAARIMARLMALLRDEAEGTLTVLTATSGDTGGAVAHAFHGVQGTRVVILYPRGRVSPLQERQFATLGGNVQALAVDGTFDDCQRLAKGALSDRELQATLQLTSANSINIGRLLPQTIYHAHAWAQLPPDTGDVIVAVPSGNFGNLTAGLMTKRLGVPIERFVAATNVNDVVPEYLRTGIFKPRAAAQTISSAMDVGSPSNFARVLALYGNSRERLRRDVVGWSFTDDETKECIGEVHRRSGYLLDPHSAVGYLALRRELADRPGAVGVFLATAHPGKFRETVEPVIGHSVPLPPALETCLGREPVSVHIGPSLSALKALLLEEELR